MLRKYPKNKWFENDGGVIFWTYTYTSTNMYIIVYMIISTDINNVTETSFQMIR